MSCSSCSNATQHTSGGFAAPRAAVLAVALCGAALLNAAPAAAMSAGAWAQPPSVTVAPAAPAGWQEDIGSGQMLGEGDLRHFGFRIYHARLLGERAPEQGKAPFALELTYYRSISRERIVAASIDEMRRLSGEGVSAQQVDRWRQTLDRCLVDVRPGDQLTGVYLPGRGVRFYRGERLLATVDDDVFARAFFAIWLDPRTRDAGLRAQLLGSRDTLHDALQGVPQDELHDELRQ